MVNSISSEICQKCAKCCQKYPFVKLAKDEINALEHTTKLHSAAFTSPIGNADEEYFLHFQENGDCFFLHENNGRYTCRVYETRPELCKKYPSKDRQCKRYLP